MTSPSRRHSLKLAPAAPGGGDSRTDSELIRAARKGSDDAFGVLYYRHRDWTYRLAWRFTRDHDLAQDAVQETFLYVAKSLPRLELTARFTTFLYPIVRSVTASILRKRRESIGAAPSEGVALESGIDSRDSIESESLLAVLSQLSEQHQEVILLRFVHDMELADIAAAMGVPTGTIKSRLHHALRALRTNPELTRFFGPEPGEDPGSPTASHEPQHQ